MYYEVDRNLNSSLDSDVKRRTNIDAISERILEWLETPQGSLADLPHWGHNLSNFKHDTGYRDIAVGIELTIVEKLPKDVEGIILNGVGVEEKDIDLYEIYILHQLGVTTAELNLE